MALRNNNHSEFDLKYRLVMPINDRKPILSEAISDKLKEIFDYISPNYNIKCTEWSWKEDHLDVRFEAHPNTELSKFINAFKSAGSRLVKKEFEELQGEMADGQFWSKSFCLLTIGTDDNDEIIDKYLMDLLIDKRKKRV